MAWLPTRSPWTARSALLLSTIAAGIGCSLIFPASSVQCTKDTDCAARGFASAVCVSQACVQPPADDASTPETSVPDAFVYPKGWECLANPDWPKATQQPLVISQPVEDVLTATRMPGVSMQPCGAADPDCKSPLAKSVLTDDAGTAQFNLYNGFDGYMDTAFEGGVPALLYVTPPLFSTDLQYTADLITTDLFQQLVGLTTSTPDGGQVAIDPTAGHIFIFVQGCNWKADLSNGAAGVEFLFDRTGPNVGQAYFRRTSS